MKTGRKKIRLFLFILAALLLLPLLLAFLAFTFYKKEITGLLTDRLKTEYNLEAEIGEIELSLFKDWPNSSITLSGTEIKNPGNNPFFRASKMSLSFDLSKLLQKKFIVRSVSISDAYVQLQVDSAGKNNFNFKQNKQKKEPGSGVNFDVQKIELNNVKFLFVNKARKKIIGFVMKDVHARPLYLGNTVKTHIYGELFVNQLLFKPKKGPFLYNRSAHIDWHFDYYKDLKSFFLRPNSVAVIDGQTYNMSAYAELEKKPVDLILRFSAASVNANKTIDLLNTSMRKFLYQFNFKKSISADILILTHLGKDEDPQVTGTVSTTDNNVIVGEHKIPYSDVSSTGRIICVAKKGEVPDMSKAVLIFKKVTGKIYKFPFKAFVLITDFTNPFIQMKGTIEADAADLNFEKNKKISLKGNCYASFNYSGPTRYMNIKEFLSDSMNLDADFEFKKIIFKAGPKVPEYGLDGKAKVKNDHLLFHNLVLTTKGGKALLSGDAKGFSSYASNVANGFDAKITAVTDNLDITPLLIKNEHKKEKDFSDEIRGIKRSDYNFSVNFKGKKVAYRKFFANNVDAHINYANSLVSVPKLNLQACKGSLSASAQLKNFNLLIADVNLKGMDIKQLFEECEEFKQTAIHSENLRGILDATVNISADVDQNFRVDPNFLKGRVKLDLKNGHLLNYEPMKKISNFVFKNRDFDDISFTEINETFDIAGTQLYINEFELASNVVNMYIEGTYDFKQESNINFRIPWSNLKRRGENYVPKNLGEAGKDARGLKLNYSGLPGKLKLKLGNR
jgi:uncharacterized protein involved in outer membrane biogenesis